MINHLLLLTTTKKAEKNLWEYIFQKMPTKDTMNKSMIYALVLVVDLKKSRRKRKSERGQSQTSQLQTTRLSHEMFITVKLQEN